ncbi:hypothetical protein [Gluconobacter cerinus]|nr:hypothetical protein [Gluconobacter cerinus]
MSNLKNRHVRGELMLWAVRWYCLYSIRYRDFENMLAGHSATVDDLTIYC